MIVFVTFLQEHEVTTEFLTLLTVDKCDAGSMYVVLVCFLDSINLPLGKIARISTHGAPVMLGGTNGLTGRLRLCIPHLGGTCAKDSAEALPELGMVDVIIRTLAEHLGRSSTSHTTFKELQAVFTQTNLELQGIHAVRWLSRGDVIARFVKVLLAVVVLLEQLDSTNYHMYPPCSQTRPQVDLTAVQSQLRWAKFFIRERYIDCGQQFGAGASAQLSPFLARHSAPCSTRVTVQGVDTDGQPREHEFTLHEEPINGYKASTGDLQSCIQTCHSFATELLYNSDFRLGDLSNLNAVKLFMPRSWPRGKEARDVECMENMEKLAVMFHACDRDEIMPGGAALPCGLEGDLVNCGLAEDLPEHGVALGDYGGVAAQHGRVRARILAPKCDQELAADQLVRRKAGRPHDAESFRVRHGLE
ncbi:unnamed protein product [Closterium sp. NIES-54]